MVKLSVGPELLQNILAVLIATTLLFNGAVDHVVRAWLIVSFGLASCLVLLVPLKCGLVRPLLRRILVLSIGLIFWGGLQALPLPLWLPVHHIWRDLAVTFGTDHGYLSVNPSATRDALPSLILPILVLVLSSSISQTDALARHYWLKLSYVGLFVVGVSIARQMGFPESLVFSGRSLAPGQFSGVFINRNVAASFFGLTGFMLLGSVALQMTQHKINPTHGHQLHQTRFPWDFIFLAGALFLITVCLVLTRSRAGSIIGLAVLLPCLGLVLQNGLRNHIRYRLRHIANSKLSGFVIAIIMFVVFLSLYGEPVLSRIQTSQDELRWCTWGATIAAIKDNLMFGTGFATFSDVFPMYRDSSCDNANMVWLRAHNSFLEFYLGLGLPGLLLATVICTSIGKTIFIGMRNRQSLKGIPIVMAGATVFVAGHSLVDFPLQIPGIAVYFCAMIGAGIPLCLRRTNTRFYS